MELQTKNLTKGFGETLAVCHLDLTLCKGVYGLLGANGAGKTTLMRLLCGLQRPSAGEISLNGRSIYALGETYREQLGYLPQNFRYYPDFTALEFLLYVAALKGLGGAAAKGRSLELLDAVGLAQHQRHKIKTFSGGMKQRLGIAQAMLNEPRILILDEPTAGLDPKERVRFRNLISAFAQNRIVLLSTHIVSDVEYVAEKIILLGAGELLHFGSPREITRELEGRVWSCTVPAEQAQCYAAAYNTSNLRNTDRGQTVLRLITDTPPANAQPEEANLEDLYLYYFKEESQG